MRALLEALASRAVDFAKMITHEFPVDEAGRAFELVSGTSRERSLAILLKFPEPAAYSPDTA